MLRYATELALGRLPTRGVIQLGQDVACAFAFAGAFGSYSFASRLFSAACL